MQVVLCAINKPESQFSVLDYLFIFALDKNQNGCLKTERLHDICWSALRHIVEQESRQRNGQGFVFFITQMQPTGSRKMCVCVCVWEGEGGVCFSIFILLSLNLQDVVESFFQ